MLTAHLLITATVPQLGPVWHVRYRGPKAGEIRALFDTDTIPTPFMSSKPASEVLAELKSRNPSDDFEVSNEAS